MIREPVVAGQFYPGSPQKLRTMIKGLVDEKAEKLDVIGLLSPHAGYMYSGPVAGATISRIKFKDTFIIMGPSHTGMGKPFSIMTEGTWETPLGAVEIDSELAEKILASSKYLEKDHMAHLYEHSIEVQIPFLQYFKPDIKIVPIILIYSDSAIYKEIGKAIAKAIKELGREAIIIASGDMTHYEPHQSAEKKDTQAIEAMLNLDEDELTKRVENLRISTCAHAPLVSLISAAKDLGATEAELVQYKTLGDITGDYSSVVGYAGLIIKRSTHPLASLAKEAAETWVKDGEVIKPPEKPIPEMKERAGVFVSIHKAKELRGCKSQDELDPKKYGVIVEAGMRRGLLLPDLEGVDTVDFQIDICRQKAGILPDEPIKLYRFEVKRYK